MDTLTPASTCPHTCIRVSTGRPTAFVDLTARLETFVAAAGLRAGILNVQTRHTTTAIVVNEHEPLLLSDFTTLLGRAAPFRAFYRHDDAAARTVNLMPDERANGHSHCRALLLGAAASLNVVNGRVRLGRWQRVFLVELDGPREREVSMVVSGEGRR
jgi:secondary thiamine-phosphate synthase enzyme